MKLGGNCSIDPISISMKKSCNEGDTNKDVDNLRAVQGGSMFLVLLF